MRVASLAPILPQVMKEGESKQAALIWMKNSHFDRTLRTVSMDKVLITNLLNMSVVILVEVELMHFGEMCRQCLGLAEDHSVTD